MDIIVSIGVGISGVNNLKLVHLGCWLQNGATRKDLRQVLASCPLDEPSQVLRVSMILHDFERHILQCVKDLRASGNILRAEQVFWEGGAGGALVGAPQGVLTALSAQAPAHLGRWQLKQLLRGALALGLGLPAGRRLFGLVAIGVAIVVVVLVQAVVVVLQLDAILVALPRLFLEARALSRVAGRLQGRRTLP